MNEIKRPSAGDLVLYFNIKKPTHAGKIIRINSTTIEIESNWGELYVFRHALWDVPESYGNEVRFFKPISMQDSEKHYVKFIETREKFLK